MIRDRPKTTLFSLISIDGKISTGDTNTLDFDKDLPSIAGVKEGVHQYYDLEKRTDLHSLNTGKVQAKIGVNKRKPPGKTPVRFIIIDNKPHLNKKGIQYFIDKSHTLYIVTNNKKHPAFNMKNVHNMQIIYYPGKIDFPDLFKTFKKKYKVDAITIQSGGTLNATLLRERLVDYVSVVITPLLIGGKDTPSLVDGESLHTTKELKKIRTLKLKRCKVLKYSYLHLYYEVMNS